MNADYALECGSRMALAAQVRQEATARMTEPEGITAARVNLRLEHGR